MNEILQKKISYKIGNERTGDVPICYADSELAKCELNWKCKYGLKKMCLHSLLSEKLI